MHTLLAIIILTLLKPRAFPAETMILKQQIWFPYAFYRSV